MNVGLQTREEVAEDVEDDVEDEDEEDDDDGMRTYVNTISLSLPDNTVLLSAGVPAACLCG